MHDIIRHFKTFDAMRSRLHEDPRALSSVEDELRKFYIQNSQLICCEASYLLNLNSCEFQRNNYLELRHRKRLENADLMEFINLHTELYRLMAFGQRCRW